jgi:hypothetical protein
MRLRTAQGRLKVKHSIIDGVRGLLERLLADNPATIRSVIPGVIRPVRARSCSSAPLFRRKTWCGRWSRRRVINRTAPEAPFQRPRSVTKSDNARRVVRGGVSAG